MNSEELNTQLVKNLIELLTLEEIDTDIYRGPITKEPWRRVFGGQVVGQALMAACHTIKGRKPHSLHAYFMRPGDPLKPIIYEVLRDRDGGTFSSRRVIAKQNGLPILNLSCSFQIEESGFEHQDEMADFPPPEGLLSRTELLRKNIEKFPESMRANLLEPRAVEFRQIPNANETGLSTDYWFRIQSQLPDDKIMQRVILAYLSDYMLLGASLSKHGKNWFDENLQVASLDHAVWFHEDPKLDDWHIYSTKSPWAGGGRSLNHGMIYDKTGKLIASTMQEALIRIKKK